MSLWTCLKCLARRAVGIVDCPQCGHPDHAEGDTVSPAVGVEGAPQPPADLPPAAPVAPAAPPVAATPPAPAPAAPVVLPAAPAAPVADAKPETPPAS